LYFAAGDYKRAIEQSEHTLRLSPDLPAAQICIAMALREQGHVEEAIGRLQHVLELTPDDPRVRAELAKTLETKQHASRK
jgi:predicted Zn-dependent protease